jgi:hypothetical protein
MKVKLIFMIYVYLPFVLVIFAAVTPVLMLRAAVVGVGDVMFSPTAVDDFVAFVVLLMLVILLPRVLDVEF